MSSSAILTCQVVTQGPGPAVEFFPRSSERNFFMNGKTNPVQKASLIEEALGCTGAVWSSAGCFKRGEDAWELKGKHIELSLAEILQYIVDFIVDEVRTHYVFPASEMF
jgi:hypothetical protein